jgi:uncharacterized protein (TIGR04222 family)
MNPFDLRGPQFLVFYLALSAVTILVLRILRRRRELPDASGIAYFAAAPIHDPYLIAFLRGGKNELVRVAVVSLIDRGLLAVRDDAVQTTDVGRRTEARKNIEREILEVCTIARAPTDLFAPSRFGTAAGEYEGSLQRMELFPNDEQKSARRSLFVRALAVMLFVSATKILVALLRGRTNVGILVFLTIVAIALAAKAVFTLRTAKGDAFLNELQKMFVSLKVRAPQIQPGGATAEVVLLTAVFGVSALPNNAFPWTKQLFPRADSSGTSSCGSSGGSSCGGGGCGGGCGGCGG